MGKKRKSYVIFCSCSNTELIPSEIKESILDFLKKQGINSVIIPDLCGFVSNIDEKIEDIISSSISVKIIACYPRAVRWILNAANIKDIKHCEIINMKILSLDLIKEKILKDCSNPSYRGEEFIYLESDLKDAWIPWSPVIDYDRCSNCKQCVSFCLFEVYRVSQDGDVIVNRPENCKNNCPACARICPKTAIIFPKLDESPINGDEVSKDIKKNKNVQLDMEKLINDDLYKTLSKRRQRIDSRRRLLKNRSIEKALKERERCKNKKE